MNPKDQIHYDIAELLEKIAHLNIKLAGTNKIHPVEIDLLRSYLRELEKLTDAMPIMPLAKPSFSIPAPQNESSTLPIFDTPIETAIASAAKSAFTEREEQVDIPEPLVVAVNIEESESVDPTEPYTEPEANERVNIAEPNVDEEELNSLAWEQSEHEHEYEYEETPRDLNMGVSNNFEELDTTEGTIEPAPAEKIVVEEPFAVVINTEPAIELFSEIEIVAEAPVVNVPTKVEEQPLILSFFDAPAAVEHSKPEEAMPEALVGDKDEKAAEEPVIEAKPRIADTPFFTEAPIVEPEGKRSLNDMFSRESKEDLGSRFLFQNRKNLREMIDLSERYVFTKELFGGDADYYDRAIRQLNQFETLREAEAYMNNELYHKYNWAGKDAVQQQFARIVERRFI